MDIEKVCKEILKEYENIIFAYIFGSYVTGKLRKDSDIDIAIYLEGHIEIETYLKIKADLTHACRREVDLAILNEASPLLKFEVYRNHKLIFTRDRDLESNFKVKTLFEYNDIKPYLDLVYKKNIQRLKEEVKYDG